MPQIPAEPLPTLGTLMPFGNSDFSNMHRAISDELGDHWRLFLFQGTALIVLGIIAVVAPLTATVAVDFFVGYLLLISGVVGLIAVFSARNLPAFLWGLVTAVLSAGVGAILIWNPVMGAISLTALLTWFFIVEGIFQIATSFPYREVTRNSWGWMVVSGVADLVMAAIIISGWPQTATWALGLLVGINLITSGWAIMMTALAGRRITLTGATAKA